MRLEWVKVSNFRQFVEEMELKCEKEMTVVAGANNSGKTSLLELTRMVLGDKNNAFKKEDVPVRNVTQWWDKIKVPMDNILGQNTINKEKFEFGLKEELLDREGILKKEYQLEVLEMKISITYEEKDDDIQRFTEYYMDLEKEKRNFYFLYRLELNQVNFLKGLKEKYQRIKRRYDGYKKEKNIDRLASFQQYILEVYFKALEEKVYFCNESFDIKEKMEKDQLKKLFHIRFIEADRKLDDVSHDKSNTLSKEIIGVLEKADKWNELMEKLPENVLKAIEDEDIKKIVQNQSLDSLKKVTEEILKTNGGKEIKPEMMLDMNEASIQSLLSNVMIAKYEVDNYYLEESSQGLGLSNMIYIHLQLQKFIEEYDPQRVNLFLLEEPESHMHPQMQQVFMKYLKEMDRGKAVYLQGIISTHSTEMVAVAELDLLRVVRVKEDNTSKIVDLSSISREFYSLLFEIGYSEIIFADKAILYEGDTERMYLKSLINLEKYKKLKQQYIAFIQVGGAYAYEYKSLLELLDIKTLIITDIDYEKNLIEKDKILSSNTSNSAIQAFYRDYIENEKNEKAEEMEIEVRYIYDWQKKNRNQKGKIFLVSQMEEDGYSRTLEEAMLCRKYGMTVEQSMEKKEWEQIRGRDKLKFSLPRKIMEKDIVVKVEDQTQISLRDILRATSGKKTDFMYSVLLGNYGEEMEPHYIEEGLKWLME